MVLLLHPHFLFQDTSLINKIFQNNLKEINTSGCFGLWDQNLWLVKQVDFGSQVVETAFEGYFV